MNPRIICTNINILMQCKSVPHELGNVMTYYAMFSLNEELLICTDNQSIIFSIDDKETLLLNIILHIIQLYLNVK